MRTVATWACSNLEQILDTDVNVHGRYHSYLSSNEVLFARCIGPQIVVNCICGNDEQRKNLADTLSVIEQFDHGRC